MDSNLPGVIDTIREKLAVYLLAYKAHEEALSAKNQPRRPDVPDTITSQEDYDLYTKLLEDYEDQKKKAIIAKKVLKEAANAAEKALADAIPIEHCWFKIDLGEEVYAVGTYWDSWGGLTRRCRVKPWIDNPRPIRDPIYN
jgi:hypothetical protein